MRRGFNWGCECVVAAAPGVSIVFDDFIKSDFTRRLPVSAREGYLEGYCWSLLQ